jgi:hypothetical protein
MRPFFLTLLAGSLALGGCTVSEDDLEPNDDPAHATPLAIGQQREAIVILGNHDFYAAAIDGPRALRFRLRSTGHEKEARIALVGADGTLPELLEDPACAAADAPLPRSICRADGFDLDAAFPAGAKPVVVVYQPMLCVDCFTPESSEYTLALDELPAP